MKSPTFEDHLLVKMIEMYLVEVCFENVRRAAGLRVQLNSCEILLENAILLGENLDLIKLF